MEAATFSHSGTEGLVPMYICSGYVFCMQMIQSFITGDNVSFLDFVGNGSESGNKPSMGAAGPSLPSLPQRPAARKSAAATALDTAGRITQRPAVTSSTQITTTTDESANGETAEGNDTREKLQNIRVKFLRLAHRLGQSPQNVVVAQVLYRLGLAESLRGGNAPNRTGAFSFDRANALAEEQEAANQEEELDFACTILVLGKTGVGKSATINSIFDDRKSVTSAFKPSTNKVQEIVGTVHGIKVCIYIFEYLWI